MNKIKCNAKVRWFDQLTGEGMVRLTDGEYAGTSLPIYACNVEGKKTWYPETACVYYDKGQEIEVEVKWDSYATFVIGLTPGTLDQEAWDSLDQDRLAFKCNEDGATTNGLFSK